jgi:RuvB-like protein 1 (pontin 52)
LASLAGRNEIQVEDVGEMGELFLDAKRSAGIIQGGGEYISLTTGDNNRMEE